MVPVNWVSAVQLVAGLRNMIYILRLHRLLCLFLHIAIRTSIIWIILAGIKSIWWRRHQPSTEAGVIVAFVNSWCNFLVYHGWSRKSATFTFTINMANIGQLILTILSVEFSNRLLKLNTPTSTQICCRTSLRNFIVQL